VTDAISKNDKPYKKLNVTDGISSTTVMVWAKECGRLAAKDLEIGHGVRMYVKFDPERHIFVLARGSTVERLQLIDGRDGTA